MLFFRTQTIQSYPRSRHHEANDQTRFHSRNRIGSGRIECDSLDPEKVNELERMWLDWAHRANVLPWPWDKE